MKRQIRNAITSFAITVFAGLGLMAFGQSPQTDCPVQPVAQPVVVQQPVEPTCTQPTVIKQTVEDFVVQPVAQPQTCTQQTTTCCADMCELVRSIESNADDLRKYFRRSARCLDCIDDSYYESVKEFERATDRLKKEYKRDCNNCDITQEVQEVLALANCISRYMDPCSLCPEATEAWTALTCDLQTLAGQYCTTASFQQPISLACPVPVCAQPTCAQPVQLVQPVQPVVVQPAPVVAPACPVDGNVIYK
ncbi:MAG TPA: hypothetical protein VFV58_26735 [Blastocatellia bacterium]|nr:hypothetical protein [Blastocatellia bacterium]